MTWISFSLLASVMAAIMTQINHHLQMRPPLVILLRSVFTLLFLAPIVAQIMWPHHTSFFVYFFFAAFFAFAGDIILFEAARRHGGRLTSMFMPVKIITAFVLWAVIDRLFLVYLFDNPLTSSGILFFLLLSVYAVASMRNCDTSWPAFKQVAWVGVFYTLLDVFIKLGMEGTDMSQTALLFVFIRAFIGVPIAVLMLRFQREEGALESWRQISGDKRALFLGAGVLLGAISVVNSYSINMAIGLSPNPGYVSVLMLLSVAWLSGYNRLRGYEDRASVKNIILLVVSAAGLILLTR